ncbi:MAG: hypothetical protein GQ527_07485 [Bacteroidales bacterium]|nr:hypothetical protein [Bacteroidales bacterium]
MNDHYQNSYSFFGEKFENKTEDQKSLILVAHELKTPENMGSIIRLAANLNAEKVYFLHEKFVVKKSKLERVAHSSLGNVDFEIITEDEFLNKIDPDYKIIALETTTNSQNVFTTNFPPKCMLLCGNERFGLPNHLISKCDQSIFIPIPGTTRSMNVSHALTLAAFEWARQHRPQEMSIK